MPRSPEHNESKPEAVSNNRPPVLNPQNCTCNRGCRCGGEGAEDGGTGNNSEDGAATSPTTLVPSSNPSETGEGGFQLPASYELLEEHVGPEDLVAYSPVLPMVRDIQEFLSRFGEMNGGDRVMLGDRMMGLGMDEGFLFRSGRALHAGSPDSMRNHAGSDGRRSSPSSIHGSMHSISPGFGLPTWADEALFAVHRMEVQVNRYWFTQTPLSLTPQRSNCRGLVASHLVVHDR